MTGSLTSPTRAISATAFLVSLIWSAGVQSAAINLPPPPDGDVDITTFGAKLTYTYSPICADSKGKTGTCGTKYTIPRWDLTTGKMVITGTSMVLDPDSGGPIQPYAVNANGAGQKNFSFTANFGFNATGTALVLKIADDRNDDLIINGKTAAPGFEGPLLVSAEIADATTVAYGGGPWAYPFGYQGQANAAGGRSSGFFEFVLMNMTGNLRPGIVYMKAQTTDLLHPLLTTSFAGTWDSKGIDFWKYSFSATNVRVDTYVPLPAALALFGSAVATFFGIRRKQLAA